MYVYITFMCIIQCSIAIRSHYDTCYITGLNCKRALIGSSMTLSTIVKRASHRSYNSMRITQSLCTRLASQVCHDALVSSLLPPLFASPFLFSSFISSLLLFSSPISSPVLYYPLLSSLNIYWIFLYILIMNKDIHNICMQVKECTKSRATSSGDWLKRG